MAIVATFSADFTKWNEGLRNAQANLKPLEVSAKGLQRQLEQAAKAFSGVEIKKQADIAVAAVKAIGGASKLTADELRKFGTTVDAAVEKLKRMGTAVPDSLTKAQHDIVAAQKAIAEESTKLDAANTKSTASFKGLVAGYAAGLATFEVAKRVLGGVVSFVEGSIESYAKAEAATKRLTVALAAQGQATPAVIRQYEKLSAQFQETTVFSDDLITEMEALFTQIGNVGPDQMGAALKAATDLAAGLGIDLEQAVTAVAKATTGSATALNKLAPSLDDAAVKGGDLAEIAAEIEKHFGGQAAAQLDTYAGRVKQLANEWDNVKEAIGGAIANDPIIQASLRGVANALGGAGEKAQGFTASQIVLQGAVSSSSPILANFIDLLIHYADATNKAAKETQHLNDLPPPQLPTIAGDFTAGLASAQKAMRALTADQRANIKAGDAMHQSIEEITKELNKNAKETKVTEAAVRLYLESLKASDSAARKSAEANKKQAESIRDLRGEISGANLLEDLHNLQTAWDGLSPAQKEQAIQIGLVVEKYQALTAKLPSIPPNLRAFAVAMNEAAERTGRMSLQIGELKPLIEALGPTLDKSGQAFRDWGVEVGFERGTPIIPFYKSLGEVISRLPEDIEKPKKATEDWADSLRDVSRAFAEIAQVSKGAMSTTFTLLAQLATSASLAAESVKSISKGMKELDEGEGFKSNVAGWAAITEGILGAVAAAIQFGKAIKDALTKSDAERALDELSREWGVTIGENLAQQIEDTMKTKFQGLRNNRWLSEVFHLGDIIADVGGITVKNLPALQKQLRQAFVFLSEGAFDVADVQHVLDSTFNQFVEFFTSRNKILSKELVEIIRLNHQLGVDSKVVLDFVAQQSSRAGSALLTVFNETGTAFAGLGQKIAAAEEAVAEARKKGSSSDIVKANAELTRLLTEQHRGAEQLGAEVNRLGGFILATFNAGIASGLSFQQALAGVQEPLKRLIDLQKDLGLDENNPALKALEVASQVASSQAGQAAAATNELILALSNIGGLTSETFKGVEDQLKDVYLRVQSQVAKAGGGTKEALQQILPSLQSIIDASKEYGFTIDDNTQELIDQAVALGLLTGEAAEKIPDAAHGIQQMSDVLLVGFGALIEAVGGELPAAFQTLRDKALQNLSDINTGVEGLPDGVTIPIDFPRGELPAVPPEGLPDNIKIPIDFPLPDIDPFRKQLLDLGPEGAQAFDAIQKAMGDFQAGVPGAVDELKAAFGLVWDKLPPDAQAAFQQILAAAEAALGHDGIGGVIDNLPDTIDIPVTFPRGELPRVPPEEFPDHIDIPVNLPLPDLGGFKKTLFDLGPEGEKAFSAIQKALVDFQAGVPGAADELKAAFGEVWDKLPPDAREAFQRMLEEAKAALGKDGIGGEIDNLPDTIDIPVNFPRGELPVVPPSDLPDHVDIPIEFPTPDDVALPKFPDGIDIPIDFPIPDTKLLEDSAGNVERVYRHAWDEVRAGGVEASDEVMQAWLEDQANAADRIPGPYTDCWGHVTDGGFKASTDVMKAWIDDQGEAAGQIRGPFSDAWGTITDDGVTMSEHVADAIRSIPDGMPEVRDRIIEAMKRAGTVASGKDGIGRIADALKDLPDLAKDAASDIEDRLSDIDVDDIRIHYRYALDGERPDSISPLVERSRQQFASGTPGFNFQDFGVRTPVDLHGREAVVRYEDRGQAAAAWSPGTTGSGGDHTTVNVYMNGSYVDRGELIRDVRTAVVEAVSKNKQGSRNRMREALGVK